MRFILEQIETKNPRRPLWEMVIPNECLPDKPFEAIEHFLRAYLSEDYEGPGTPTTEVVKKDDGIHVTFLAGRHNPPNLVKVFAWMEKPYPYAT